MIWFSAESFLNLVNIVIITMKNPHDNKITTFLVNDKKDANGFQIDWDAIKQNAQKWIGVSGILYRKCDMAGCRNDHTAGGNLSEALELSEDVQVTEIIDVTLDESTHTAYAIQNVTSAKFHDMICKNEIQYVSQSIWLEQEPADPDNIHVTIHDNFTPVHLAFVDDPAYGSVAKVTEKPACNNILSLNSTKHGMGDSETPEKKEHQMSNDEMIKEIHSMLKSVIEEKEKPAPEKKESTDTEHKEDSTKKEKAESTKKPAEEQKTDSSKKPHYSFNWPDQKPAESAMLSDLIQ